MQFSVGDTTCLLLVITSPVIDQHPTLSTLYSLFFAIFVSLFPSMCLNILPFSTVILLFLNERFCYSSKTCFYSGPYNQPCMHCDKGALVQICLIFVGSNPKIWVFFLPLQLSCNSTAGTLLNSWCSMYARCSSERVHRILPERINLSIIRSLHLFVVPPEFFKCHFVNPVWAVVCRLLKGASVEPL